MWGFAGMVQPETARLSMPAMRVEAATRLGKSKATVTFRVDNSIVIGTVELLNSQNSDLVPTIARQHVQYRIDLEGFAHGAAYDFRMRSMWPSEHVEHMEIISTNSSALGGRDAIRRRTQTVNDVRSLKLLGMESTPLRAALADLRLAMLESAHAPYFAFRVIESLRQYFVGRGTNTREESWNAMHQALATSKTDMDVFYELSATMRNGEFQDITNEQGEKFLQIASRFIESFLAYAVKKHKNQVRDANAAF